MSLPKSSVCTTASVTLSAPCFAPGSVVSATITLHAENKSQLTSSQSTSADSFSTQSSNVKFSQFTSATSSSVLLTEDATSRVDYVVCELSGRWSSDRSWVVPNVHPIANPNSSLDNHTHQPLASASTPRILTLPTDPRVGPYPWSAVLADANSIGGGGRIGHAGTIFRSQPLVVCEREQIPVGSQVSFTVDCVLPDQLPPTIRGAAMRYYYALLIAIKFPDQISPKLVRVPFRVVSVYNPSNEKQMTSTVIPVPTPRSVGPSTNTFLHYKETSALSMTARLLKSTPPEDIEIALALSLNGRLTAYKSDVDHGQSLNALDEGKLVSTLHRFQKDVGRAESGDFDDDSNGIDDYEENGINEDQATSMYKRGRSKKNLIPVYSITRNRDAIARIYLSKQIHHLGDTISAIFHFQGDKPCYRLEAKLEAQEILRDTFSVGTKRGSQQDNAESGIIFRKVYGEHGEFVMSNRNTHVTFSIPHDAPTSFSTDVISVRWFLHFIFLIPRAGKESEGPLEIHDEEDDEISGNEEAQLITKTQKLLNGNMDWEGGVWSGEDPANWTHLPKQDVDVLRWTLPISVSGESGSPWGPRTVQKIFYSSSVP